MTQSIKCEACGYEAPASLWGADMPCPRGRLPQPKSCGKDKPLTEEQKEANARVGGTSPVGLSVQGARSSR